jgi:hypothetical protein
MSTFGEASTESNFTSEEWRYFNSLLYLLQGSLFLYFLRTSNVLTDIASGLALGKQEHAVVSQFCFQDADI